MSVELTLGGSPFGTRVKTHQVDGRLRVVITAPDGDQVTTTGEDELIDLIKALVWCLPFRQGYET